MAIGTDCSDWRGLLPAVAFTCRTSLLWCAPTFFEQRARLETHRGATASDAQRAEQPGLVGGGRAGAVQRAGLEFGLLLDQRRRPRGGTPGYHRGARDRSAGSGAG